MDKRLIANHSASDYHAEDNDDLADGFEDT